jgi:diguanylate cyclase (GGDEF)-like protein
MVRPVVVLIALLLCTTGTVALAVAGEAHPLRLSEPVRDHAGVTYTIIADQAVPATIVLLPVNAERARLTRGSLTVQDSRNAIFAFGLLGHALPTLRLDNVQPGEHIVLRIEPSTASPPRLVGDVDVLEAAQLSAGITGVAFGILLAVTLWQSAVFWLARDLTIVPFLLAVATRATLEGVRGGLISAHLFGSSGLTIFILDVLAGAAEIAFIVGFLRLERRVTLGAAAASIVVLGGALSFVWLVPAAQPVAEPVWSFVRITVALGLIGVAAWRFRSGFKPAIFALIGIAGNLGSTLYLVVLDRTGAIFPPLDPWMFQIGTAVPALVLAVGIPYRTRFIYGEREALENDLRAAEFAAEHDPLTGLLNRRGLAAWVAKRRLGGGCLLFIDLDGFKRVNDHAGHEAGDRALMAVAGVLTSAVRTGDAVARVGGDEFVVVLDQRSGTRAAEISLTIAGDIEALTPAGPDIRIGASIGRADFDHEPNFKRTLALADADAYRVKAERRARTQT